MRARLRSSVSSTEVMFTIPTRGSLISRMSSWAISCWMRSATRRLRRAPVAPAISISFNWASWGIAIGVGSVLGALLAGITPFKPGQAFMMALIACVAGSLGHLVMKAIKRDRGIPDWGQQGDSVTGANGLLDRVDALCFSAPVFFHSVRWYFDL